MDVKTRKTWCSRSALASGEFGMMVAKSSNANGPAQGEPVKICVFVAPKNINHI